MSETTPPFQPQTMGDRDGVRDGMSDPTTQGWTAVPLPEDWAVAPGTATPREIDPRAEREAELLDLIRDLNRCNEALLSRVHQLEQSLEATQQALQTEVEQGGRSAAGQADPMAMAQQRSMAQLLQELEGANDALKRQRILSETLQGQLTASQERVQELEGDVGRLQQRHGEQSQALFQAEDTVRDLRSRLQRQQRYTLQFKAALEKCLDMTALPSGGLSLGDPAPAPLSPAPPSGRGMPRAHRIQPWSLWEGETPPLDPHLRALLRAPTVPGASAPQGSPESEDPLWRDLEAVIEQSLDPVSGSEPIPAPAPELPPELPPALAPEPPAPTVLTNRRTPTPQPVPSSTFTEPSPWGPPRPVAEATLGSEADQETAIAPPSEPEPAPYRPLGTQPSGPSPLVHPLRPPQKKRTSLSAVELPQFPRLSRS